MDYVEAFKNLRTNNKYGRKSPHKAVLMLTVIEMYEKNIITDNEIYYDDSLKTLFLKVWNKVLPNEPLFHPEAYLPFWYLQNDSFWHIVPFRGKEDILSLMRDTNIKPSEAKLNDSVKCAELDEDLYFLMTLPSGRSSLKRALLETYFNLTEEQIEKLSESSDNSIDYSVSALSEFENILSKKGDNVKSNVTQVDEETLLQFNGLNEDLQIALNYEYYSFLKKHRREREMIKEVCPTVFDLYHNIVNHPIRKEEITPSIAFLYENFLSDLKISLMSEDGAMDLIDNIDAAIEILRGNNVEDDRADIEEDIYSTEEINEQKASSFDNKEGDNGLEVEHVYLNSSGNIIKTITTQSLEDSEEEEKKENRKGKPWTEDEEERITLYFQRGIEIVDIAEKIGRSEVAVKMRLAKLGLIEYTYGQDDNSTKSLDSVESSQADFAIENTFTRCYILNKHGEKVYATEGRLKYINSKLYRLNFKDECFTVKGMLYNGEAWMKGNKKIVAYPGSKLYPVIDAVYEYDRIVEDILDSPDFWECRLKVNGEWYDNNGELISVADVDNSVTDKTLPGKVENISKPKMDPQYTVRKQAILRALGYFRTPAKIKDVVRTISRTAWGDAIMEDDVEKIIKTLSEVECVDGSRYILRRRS